MRTDDLSLPDDMDLLKAMVRAMAEKTTVLEEENAALKARSLDADARRAFRPISSGWRW